MSKLTKKERAEWHKHEKDFYAGKDIITETEYCGMEETFEQKEARLKKKFKLNF